MKLELCTHQELPYKEIYVNGVNIFMLPIKFFILTDALKYYHYSKDQKIDTDDKLIAKKMLDNINEWLKSEDF